MKKSLKFGIRGVGIALFFIVLFLVLAYINSQTNFDSQGLGITLLTFPITIPRLILGFGYVELINKHADNTDIIWRNIDLIIYILLAFIYFLAGFLIGKLAERKN